MSTIDLYEVLKRIPSVSSDEAKSVADTLVHTDDVATKAGLTKIESKMVELEMRLTWRMIITVGIFNSMLFLALKFTG